jgi:transcription antitermination factor NusG
MQNVITFHTGVAEEPEKKRSSFCGGQMIQLDGGSLENILARLKKIDFIKRTLKALILKG